MDDFKTMQEYVNKMQATSKTKEKEAILKEYQGVPFVRSCVWYTLNPFWMYGVTSKQVMKYIDNGTAEAEPIIHQYKQLFDLLNDLEQKVLTGHDAINHIIDFVSRNRQYAKLIFSILDKDIETRANATLVNKVWGKGFIPTFDVALAKSYDDVGVDFSEGWYASRKLDGLRCICKVDNDSNARFYSRKGKEFLTLGVLAKSIKQSGLKDIVLDGELCIMNDDLEDFKQISREYNKKGHTIATPKFFVFDILFHEEFNSGKSDNELIMRWHRATSFNGGMPDGFELLEQRWVLSGEEVSQALDTAESHGHEGVILRKNTGYKGKRSGDILKVKKFKDAEFTVKQVYFGKMRFIEDDKDVERETMSAVRITYKGEDVNVGSGWSKEERADFYENPEKILGKVITVKYKQETRDSEGKVSLQFPTVKAIHYGGRSV